MPELPEVETVARGLRRTIVGRRILSVRLGKTDFMDDPAALEQHLPGRRIEAVERYGKFMLFRLSQAIGADAVPANGDPPSSALLVHLGMTGQIAPNPAAQPCEKHTHACFLLDDDRELRYTDARRFGRLAYLSAARLAEELRVFGADPLEISSEEFVMQARSRRARIKALLLDQSFLRGVGNIYADESLWRAKLHPGRLGSTLKRAEAKKLHRVLREILKKRLLCTARRFPIFLTPRASLASINCITGLTAARESLATVAARPFAAPSSRAAVAISVRNASRGQEDVLPSRCREACRSEQANKKGECEP